MNTLKPKLDLANFFWCILVFLPILLKETYFRKIIEWFPFDIFHQNALIILSILFILAIITISNEKLQQNLLKWIFPILIWLGCYFHDFYNHSTYLIIIFLFYFIIILYKLVKEIIKNEEVEFVNKGLISDDPIEADEEIDSFGRIEYAQSIVSEISKTVNKRAFNIAITGAWGSGKTSFLNLIKGDMQNYEKYKNQFITVKYNPWDFKEDKIIGLDLLKTISHELGNEKDLLEKFKGLMVSLQGVDQSPWYKVIPYFLSGFSKEKSIVEYRKEIGNILGLRCQKLVIFLDDLDRLDGDEILEVFKTIRNSFDIANTFFILGFDIEYVADQIEGKVKGERATDRAVEYLEKIFQMRLSMPSNADIEFSKILSENITALFKVKTTFSLENIKIVDYRQVYSIINALKIFTSKNDLTDFNINTLIIIEYIKIRYPKLHKNLMVNFTWIRYAYLGFDISSQDPFDKFRNESRLGDLTPPETDIVIELIESLDIYKNKQISKSQFLKYFKFSMPDDEFYKSILLEAIRLNDIEIINENKTLTNEKDLLLKLDNLVKNNLIEYTASGTTKKWIDDLMISILFKEESGLSFYGYQFYILENKYFKNHNEIIEIIGNLNSKQTINYIFNLKDASTEVLDELLKAVKNYVEIENKIDQFFWESINIVERYQFDTVNLKKKKLYTQNFKDIGKEFIMSSFLTSIQQYVSFSRPDENRTVLRGANSVIDYYLTGLFSADDWLLLLPENYQLDDKLLKIHSWLKEISEKGNDQQFDLDYLSVFGQDFSDFRMSSGLVVK
ncbi:MAG: P-loop NTPase fold protein [Saprospiraceae bacterium]